MLPAPIAIPAMLATWIVMALVFIGLGKLLVRPLGLRTDTGLFDSLWVGVAGFFLLAQVAHLFFPTNLVFVVVVGVLGVLGLWLYRSRLRLDVLELFRHKLVLVAVLVTSAWIASRAMQRGEHIDSIVYQYHAVRWPSEHAIVPGLVNLNFRLGFNTASCLLNSALESTIWSGASAHLVNSFWVTVVVAHSLFCMRRLAGPGEIRSEDFLGSIVVLPALTVALSSNIASPTTDPPAMVFSLMMMRYAMQAVASEPGDRAQAAGLVLLLGAVASAAKVSQLPLCGSVCLLVLILTARSSVGWSFSGLPWRCLGLGATLAVIYMIRSVILTGYPLYPLPKFGMPVDWTVPAALRDLDMIMIEIDARMTHDPLAPPAPLLQWLPVWVRAQLSPMNIAFGFFPLVSALILLPLLAVLRPRGKHQRLLLLLIPCAVAGLAWFRSAPHGRFAAAFAWGALAVILVALMSRLPWRRVPLALATVAWLAAGAFPLGALLYRPARSGAIGPDVKLIQRTDTLLQAPPSPVPRVFDGPLGIPMYLPPAFAKGCGDGPIPATPYLSRSVVLRNPSSLAGGFRQSTQPRPGPDSRQIQRVVDFIRANSQPGDRAMVFEYEGSLWSELRAAGAPDITLVEPDFPPRDSKTIGAAVAKVRESERFWLILSDEDPQGRFDLTSPVLFFADWGAARVNQIDLANVSVYLFNRQ